MACSVAGFHRHAEAVAPVTIQFELGWLHVQDKQDNVRVTTSAFAETLDAGLIYLVHTDLQLDVFAGVGLSDAADGWFLGAGLVYRIRD